MTEMEVNRLIVKCKKRDPKAFAQLCELYYDFIFRVAFRILAHEEDAKDIVQETFIKVWKHINNYTSKTKFSTWLYRIVTNRCIDELRKQQKYSQTICEEAFLKVETNSSSDQIDNTELADIIVCLAESLSPKQRAIFTLRDLEGLEMQEIAKILKMPSTAIKSNLYHARKAIRQKLIKNYKVEY